MHDLSIIIFITSHSLSSLRSKYFLNSRRFLMTSDWKKWVFIKFDLRGCFEIIRGRFWKCNQMIQIWFYYYPGIKMTKNKPQWPQYKLDLRGWCGGCSMNFIMKAFYQPQCIWFEAASSQIGSFLRHLRSEAVEAELSNKNKRYWSGINFHYSGFQESFVLG